MPKIFLPENRIKLHDSELSPMINLDDLLLDVDVFEERLEAFKDLIGHGGHIHKIWVNEHLIKHLINQCVRQAKSLLVLLVFVNLLAQQPIYEEGLLETAQLVFYEAAPEFLQVIKGQFVLFGRIYRNVYDEI